MLSQVPRPFLPLQRIAPRQPNNERNEDHPDIPLRQGYTQSQAPGDVVVRGISVDENLAGEETTQECSKRDENQGFLRESPQRIRLFHKSEFRVTKMLGEDAFVLVWVRH